MRELSSQSFLNERSTERNEGEMKVLLNVTLMNTVAGGYGWKRYLGMWIKM